MYWVGLQKMSEQEMRKKIFDATNGRSMSRKGLNDDEFSRLIGALKKAWFDSPKYKLGKSMRAKIIAIMCEMGYETSSYQPDYERINVFLEKHGTVKKQLREMVYVELRATVSQVIKMKSNHSKPKKPEYDLDTRVYQ